MADIIKIIPGNKDDGSVHMSFINGKWRCHEYEIEKAKKSAFKTKVEQEAKERL